MDQHLACAATVAGADGVLWRYADPEEQASVIRRAASGEQQFPNLQPNEIHALLDQVDDRDRAIVAMLIETRIRTTSPACWVSARTPSSCDVRAS